MQLSHILLVLSTSAVITAQVTSNSLNPVIYPLSSDPEFSFQLEAQLSLANYGGTSTGEVLRAASQITPGDFESYYSAFYYLAEKMHALASSIDAKKYPVSARDTYFRASSYYRAADFFLHGNASDPRIYTLWASALADFDKALGLLPIPGTRINVTASGFIVPVIFYKAAKDYAKRPTVLAGTGYDASQEDLYFELGKAVLERGWNFVTYEGPGQPTVRRYQNLGFIPNWWDVVTPVVDYLYNRSDVDTTQLSLTGVSYGGILAPRAASREHRFAAVLAIDGAYSLFSELMQQFGPEIAALYNSGNETEFDAIVNSIRLNASSPSSARWGIDQGLWSFDTDSPYEWVTKTRDINVTQALINEIRSPLFVGSGEHDTALPNQSTVVKDWLRPQDTYHLFKTDVGAGEHCQIGAESHLAAISLDWLDGVFSNSTKGRNGTTYI